VPNYALLVPYYPWSHNCYHREFSPREWGWVGYKVKTDVWHDCFPLASGD